MDGDDALLVRVLGPLEVQRAGSAVALTSATQRLLLARLVLSGGPVSEDQLIDDVWGEAPPASASTSLRAQLSRLRTALRLGTPDVALVHGPGGYRFEGPVTVDADRFEQLVAGARATDDAGSRRDQLEQALALWRGEALSDLRYEPFAQPAIARLESLRLTVLEERIGLDLADGRTDRIVPELEALSREHPLRERFWELLMEALAREDRVPEALAVYRRAAALQRRELGLEPSPRLQRLHDGLLRQDVPDTDPTPSSQRLAPDAALAAWRTVVGEVDLPGVSDEVRLDLLLARGEGLRHAGRTEEARRTFAAAAQLAGRLDRPDQLAAAVLGLVGPPEDSVSGEALDEALVERALLELPVAHPVLPRLQARLAVGLIDRGEHDRGRALLATALVAARDAADRAGVAYALRARHRTWFDPHALPERLVSAEELLTLGRDLESPDVRAWGHRWCSIGRLEAGDLDAVEQHLDALDELAETHSDAFHRWFVVTRRAGLALIREPEAEVTTAGVMEAVALTDRMASTYTTTAAMLLLWGSHVLQGRPEEALRLAEEVARHQPIAKPLVAWSAALAGERGRAGEVLAELAGAGFVQVLEQDRIRVMELLGLTALAETACALGDRERGRELRGLLGPLAGRLVVAPPGVTAVGAVDDTLARLDVLLA